MWSLDNETQQLLQELEGPGGWSRWFSFQRSPEATAASLLVRIAERGEPAVIPVLARYLLASSDRVRLAAAQGLQALLPCLTVDELFRLEHNDADWLWHISDAWEKLRKSDVERLAVGDASRTAVLGILSFHRSGFVREEAVHRLGAIPDGSELPFLLLRCNDWVEPVRRLASAAVEERIRDAYALHFAAWLPLVILLSRSGRFDAWGLAQRAVTLLTGTGSHCELALIEGIRSPDRDVRRGVVRIALGLREAPGGQWDRPKSVADAASARDAQRRVIAQGLCSTDAVIRLWCTRKLLDTFEGDDLRQHLRRLRLDGSMPVRRQALLIESERSPKPERELWQEALLDPTLPIRELARVRLRKLGSVDIAGFYRNALAKNPQSLPALAGVGESGDTTDLPIIRGFLSHPSVRWRAAAVRGVARIGGEAAVDELVECLRDPSPKVVREVAKQLRDQIPTIDLSRLLAVVRQSPSEHSRYMTLRLIFEAGKWRSLTWLIRASDHWDSTTSRMAASLFEAWFSPPHCNRVFTRPSEAERQEIQAALAEVPVPLAARFRKTLELAEIG